MKGFNPGEIQIINQNAIIFKYRFFGQARTRRDVKIIDIKHQQAGAGRGWPFLNAPFSDINKLAPVV